MSAKSTHPAEEASEAVGELKHEDHPVLNAPQGAGPLLQRDYVIVIDGAECTPEEAMRKLLADFPSFSPQKLASFKRPEEETGPLKIGSRMGIDLTGYGYCEVMMTDVEPHTMTMRTIEGHAEAGRISFAVYEDESGRLVGRIRSRARAAGPLLYAGHALVGKHVQTVIWITFLKRLAEACGGRVLGDVIVETDEVEDSPADRGLVEVPTILAERGSS